MNKPRNLSIVTLVISLGLAFILYSAFSQYRSNTGAHDAPSIQVTILATPQAVDSIVATTAPRYTADPQTVDPILEATEVSYFATATAETLLITPQAYVENLEGPAIVRISSIQINLPQGWRAELTDGGGIFYNFIQVQTPDVTDRVKLDVALIKMEPGKSILEWSEDQRAAAFTHSVLPVIAASEIRDIQLGGLRGLTYDVEWETNQPIQRIALTVDNETILFIIIWPATGYESFSGISELQRSIALRFLDTLTIKGSR